MLHSAPRLRAGDVLTAAWWFNRDNKKEWEEACNMVQLAILDMASQCRVFCGPIRWEEVSPLDPRVPEPPKELQGDINAMIGSCLVRGRVPTANKFTDCISEGDLLRLRSATRKMHTMTGGLGLTDAECDDIINDICPDVAAREIMQ